MYNFIFFTSNYFYLFIFIFRMRCVFILRLVLINIYLVNLIFFIEIIKMERTLIFGTQKGGEIPILRLHILETLLLVIILYKEHYLIFL